MRNTESPTPPKGVGKNKVSSMIGLSKVRAASYANSEQKSRNDSFCSSEKKTLFIPQRWKVKEKRGAFGHQCTRMKKPS